MTTSGTGRERGGCLTIYLALIIIGSIFSLVAAFSLSSTAQQLAAQGVAFTIPSWYAPASILPIILSVVGAFGTWTWKKWGVYVLVASLVASFLINAAAGQITTGAFSLVVGGLVLWWLLRSKWSYFEG